MKNFSNFIKSISDLEVNRNSTAYEYGIGLASHIINSSNDAIMICEAEPIDVPGPRIVFVNQTFVNETGYSPEEVIGETPRILQGINTDLATRGRMRDALKKWQPVREEVLNYKKNGEELWISLSIFPLANEKGWFTHWISIQHNITETKKREFDLLSTKAELVKANTELMFKNEENINNTNKINKIAFYDELTKLPNRRLLIDRLNQALIASKRTNNRGALLFLDLDRFKNLNDTRGHSYGDLLLQHVATRLSNITRESDTVSRFGGDEFVILLENLGEDATECAVKTKDIIEKIFDNLNLPFQINDLTYKNSLSMGVAFFNGCELGVDELLKQADIAMYEAKISGRNTFRFFEKKMQEAISALVGMEIELANAIEQEHFELYYQLQVDNDGQKLGAEALVRWLHNERGVILPSQFIPIAEQSGLILSLGKWVLDAACRQLKMWEEDSLTCNLTLSVNISVKQFSQKDFVDQVKTTLERHAINPALLKLEITESAFIKNIEYVISTMNILGEIGINFELDDFGTGYSSLQHLKRLPLQRLKIDQSFVRDIEFDDNDKQIVFTIIAMAKNLGLNIIAEGVETEGQKLILKNNGCQHYQGYLFGGPPIPIAQFERLLSKSCLALSTE